MLLSGQYRGGLSNDIFLSRVNPNYPVTTDLDQLTAAAYPITTSQSQVWVETTQSIAEENKSTVVIHPLSVALYQVTQSTCAICTKPHQLIAKIKKALLNIFPNKIAITQVQPQ